MEHEQDRVNRHEDQFTRIWRHVNDLNAKVVAMDGTVQRIKSDLYNGDDDPASGLVPEIRAWMHEDRSRRWKRSDKIAMVGILSVLLAWPAARCWDFIHTVYQITLDWQTIHKTEIQQKKSFSPEAPVLSYSHEQPQDAGGETHIHW